MKSILKMMLSSRHTQQDKLYNSDSLLIVLVSLFRDTVTDYSLIISLYV